MKELRKETILGPLIKGENTRSRHRDRSGFTFDRGGVATGTVGLPTLVLMINPE